MNYYWRFLFLQNSSIPVHAVQWQQPVWTVWPCWGMCPNEWHRRFVCFFKKGCFCCCCFWGQGRALHLSTQASQYVCSILKRTFEDMQLLYRPNMFWWNSQLLYGLVHTENLQSFVVFCSHGNGILGSLTLFSTLGSREPPFCLLQVTINYN